MPVIRHLKTLLELETADFNNGLRQAQREAAEFGKTIKPTKDLLKDTGAAATSAGMLLTVAFTAPIAAIAGVGVAFNAMQEQARIAFTTMLGDGKKAKLFLDDLKDFAAKTPFEFPGLVKAAQRLMAMGFEAKNVKPLLEAVGNAVAGLGGGAAEIDRVTLALGQMQGRGKVATQEMNQLTEVGIPAWKILADKFGIAESRLRDMVEKGLIPADKAVTALTQGMNEKFGGMLDKQAQSFSGLISTIKDESRFLAGELTEGLFAAIKGPASVFTEALHGIRVSMDNWSDSSKAAIAVTAGLVAATGPALLVFGQLATGMSSLLTILPKLQAGYVALSAVTGGLMGPAGLMVIGVGVVTTLAIAFVRYQNSTADLTGKLKLLREEQDQHATSAQKLKKLLDELQKADERHGVSVEGLTSLMKAARAETEKNAIATQVLAEATGTAGKGLADFVVILDEAAEKKKKDKEAAKEAAVATKQWKAEIKELNQELEAERQRIASLKLAEMLDRINFAMRSSNNEFAQWLRAVNDGTAANDRLVQSLYKDINAFGGVDISLTDIGRKFDALTGKSDFTAASVNANFVGMASSSQKAAKEMTAAMSTALGNITSDFAKSVSAMVTDWKFSTDAMVGIAKIAAKGMLDAFLVGLLSPLTEELGKLGASMAKTLGGLFGGGSSAVSMGTQIGSASVEAAGGAASSASSSIASSASSFTPMGLLSAGIAAAGSIGVIMQLKRLEGTMNAVEHNTRYTEIQLRDTMNEILWPMHGLTQFMASESHETNLILDAIYNRLATQPAGGAFSFTDRATYNFTFQGEISRREQDQVEASFMDDLRKNRQGLLGDLSALLKSAGSSPTSR